VEGDRTTIQGGYEILAVKTGNYDKHVEFLTSRILGRFSDCYDDAELTEALVHSEALHLLDYFLWESWL